MYWKKRKITYDLLIPPLSKPVADLSPHEAEAYYNWFISQKDERIRYVSEQCAQRLRIDRSLMDLSPQSLKHLWRWFLMVAETERTPDAQLSQICSQYRNFPEAIRGYIQEQSSEQFSFQTEYILRDIGMYLGDVFTEQYHQINWGFYTTPKTDIFVNQPVLIGFQDNRFSPPFATEFEPIHMAAVQAANIWDYSQSENDLFALFVKWSRFVPLNR